MVMQLIEVPEKVAQQLNQLAEAQGRSVDAVLTELVEQYSEQLETTPEELAELQARIAEMEQEEAEGRLVLIPHDEAMAQLAEHRAKRQAERERGTLDA